MHRQRAKEIASSPVMANVEYQGDRIYIQQVNEENETARIYPLERPEQEQDVPLNQLIEH